jgi:hypothetical protein
MSRKPPNNTTPTVRGMVAVPRSAKTSAVAYNGDSSVRATGLPPTQAKARHPQPAPDNLALHMGELFAAAAHTQRAHMLACLLRPLNALSLVGVAAGAFAEFLTHKPRADDPRDLDAVSRFSPEQISALSDFVGQVDHQALLQAATAAAPRARPKGRGANRSR